MFSETSWVRADEDDFVVEMEGSWVCDAGFKNSGVTSSCFRTGWDAWLVLSCGKIIIRVSRSRGLVGVWV